MTRNRFLLIAICLLTVLCGVTTMATVDMSIRIREMEKKQEKQALLHDDLAHCVHVQNSILYMDYHRLPSSEVVEVKDE